MKKVFMNNEPYMAPEITLVEVAIESGFAVTGNGNNGEDFTFDDTEGGWD